MANLTSKEIKNWKAKVNTSIKTNLVKSLTATTTTARNLVTITKSADSELSYRFNDLQKLTTEASKQLTTFMNSFNTNLDQYIAAVEKAEKQTIEKQRQAIDQFAERAAEISRLKM